MNPELVKVPDTDGADGSPVATQEDIRKINRRLAAQRAKDGGLRIKSAFFRVPWPLTQRQYEEYRKEASEKWLTGMAKQGWELKSKVAVDGNKRKPATSYSGDWVVPSLESEVEIPVAAVFKKTKREDMRIEVPVI